MRFSCTWFIVFCFGLLLRSVQPDRAASTGHPRSGDENTARYHVAFLQLVIAINRRSGHRCAQARRGPGEAISFPAKRSLPHHRSSRVLARGRQSRGDVHDPRGRARLGEPVLRACASRAAAWIVGAFWRKPRRIDAGLAKQKVEGPEAPLGAIDHLRHLWTPVVRGSSEAFTAREAPPGAICVICAICGRSLLAVLCNLRCPILDSLRSSAPSASLR